VYQTVQKSFEVQVVCLF